jgi:hypothetical protein
MDSFAYFPTVIYRDERPDLVEETLSVVNRAFNETNQTNQGLIQTKNLIDEFSLKTLMNYILLSSVNILKEQGYDVEKYDFYLSGFWGQELKKSNGTNVHLHKNSQICGWFFLEVPENGSFPIYYDTRVNKAMIELDFVQNNEIKIATDTIFFNNVLPGTVLFNNSWMKHQLSFNNSDLPTKCLHFIVCHKEKFINVEKI